MNHNKTDSKQSTVECSLSDKDFTKVVDIKKKEKEERRNTSIESSTPEQVVFSIPADQAKVIKPVSDELAQKGLHAVYPAQLEALVNSTVPMFSHLVSLQIHMANVKGYMTEKSRIINEVQKTGFTVELAKRLVDNELALIKAKQSRDDEHKAKSAQRSEEVKAE